MHGHLTQLGRWPNISFQPDHASVCQVKADVGTSRLSTQPDAPFSRLRLPQRKVGIERREGKLFSSLHQVDAGVCGFKIGKGKGLSDRCIPRTRVGLRDRRFKKRVEIPAAGSESHQVHAGFVYTDAAYL